MPRQLHLEGPALEPVLARAREEHGPDVTVVAAHRVRRGGFAGFFAREHFEVTISVPSPEDAVPVPVQRHPLAVEPAPTTMAELLAAADRADAAPEPAAQPVARPVARPVAQPVARPVAPPVAPPVARPVHEPVPQPISLPAGLPAATRYGRPVGEPANASVAPADAEAAPAAASLPALVVPSLATPLLAAPSLAAPAARSTAQGSSTAPTVAVPEVAVPMVAVPTVAVPAVELSTADALATSDAAAAAPALVSARTVGARRPGRTLSTETRSFDEVLAALRADLLGPSGLETTGLTPSSGHGGSSPDGAAPAQPWQPVTVLEDPALPEPTTDPEAELDQAPDDDLDEASDDDLDEASDDDLDEASDDDLDQASHDDLDEASDDDLDEASDDDLDQAPDDDLDQAPVTGPAGLDRTPDLLALCRLLGADPDRARAAVAAVTTDGPVASRHLLPLLADALAEGLTADQPHDLLGARAGELVVVVDAPERVAVTAQDVATRLGSSWLARWSDEPIGGRTCGELVVQDVARVPALRARARAAGLPLVLQLADPTLGTGVEPTHAGGGRAVLLGDLDPHLVVLGGDAGAATRGRPDVAARLSATCRAGTPVLLALTGCSTATAPLAHVGRPVVLLDGRRATHGTWAGVLLDALRDEVRP